MTEWQDISTAPRGRTGFLALQDGEIYHAAYSKDGRLMFRTHQYRNPKEYRLVDAEMDGNPVKARVLISEGPAIFEHHWTFWTIGFDFKPTHWMPLPEPASPIRTNGQTGK